MMDLLRQAAPILAVEELSTDFRVNDAWRPIVRNISLTVAPSETVAIVGESGSGKSVTALSVMRLLPRALSRMRGRIVLDDVELTSLDDAAMRRIRGNRIGMIFQEPMTSLNPVLTVGVQIAETLIAHRGVSSAAAEAEAVRLLDRVRIASAARRIHDHPHSFSGGMRQRVMIAMAIACKPRLLIADEPTTALDVTIQAQILDLLKTLQQEEGMGLLFITHDMGVVAEIADRTMVMTGGEAVEMGDVGTLFAAPQHPYTRSLLASVPRLGSMAGHARPMRFPAIDPRSGEVASPVEAADTVVAGGRPLLEVNNLTTRFDIRSGVFGRLSGRVHAVEDVSFAVHAGETLALVGESGCGKSTTGRSILRLVEPQSGSIRFDGGDMLALDRSQLRRMRRSIQMISQDAFASLNPRLRAGDAIAEGLFAHGRTDAASIRERVSELMVRVGLKPDMARRFPHEFSGGQRQRICIARALALDPKLIVADESVSALDVSIKAQVINLLLDLQAGLGLSYLFISHDMAAVERIAHRVAVMYLGEIVEIGPRHKVFENPSHPYTRKLMAAVPVPDPARRVQGRRRGGDDDIASPVRAPDFVPPVRRYREISPGHLVQEWAP
ncbi:ABC transporter ATP-binding protein [Devosia sp. 66-22]|uniref:ABC transporter ATP-binding protein n=1 Tax=Devosia sp. 66-22 TaxID=1895753 RepID=UPI000AC832C9|nr:ABC transporter ATP-binding protein [Devosia sp. 66-22]